MKTAFTMNIASSFTLLLLAASAQADSFVLRSSDIQNGQALTTAQVFNGFGCSGDNRSPQLVWSNAPAGTKSFAVTVYDPDAPTGSGWWHWVVFNIPASVTSLPTDAGAVGGAHPPTGARPGRIEYGV